jgi:hypothetical protein
MDTRRGRAIIATGAVAAGLFSLGCVPPEAAPEVPPLASPAAGPAGSGTADRVPVEVAQAAGGQVELAVPGGSAPELEHDWMLAGGALTAPLEGSLEGAGATVPSLPDGRYTVVVTARDATGLVNTGTTSFTVADGTLAA